jgi:hypothetical protein
MTSTRYPISTNALADFIRRYPLDCSKHSRQLIVDLNDALRCPIPLNTFVLAALFAGYAVLPCDGGRIFNLCRVEK